MLTLLRLTWLGLTLPGIVETFRVLLATRRTYRVARVNSTDPRDWELACHVIWTEGVRLVKQLLALAGVAMTYLPEPWRVESRNAAFVAISLLLLLNSERDLAFRRKLRRAET